MAAFDTTRMPAASSVFAGRLGAWIMNSVGAFADWQQARQTRKTLSKLSDRELSDIGLIRGDIEAVASKGIAR